ncbi:MAG: hypothetical protein ACYTGZ_10830 [Planctomycetota bacterium]
MPEIVDIPTLIVVPVIALLGIILGAAARPGNDEADDSGRGLRAFEPGLLAILGGLIARLFIVALFHLFPDHLDGASAFLGWCFGLWPGAMDTIALMAGEPPVLGPTGLALWCTIAGSFTGMMDGLWRTHNWAGLGWLSFPLDMTWGLAGMTNSSLIHIVNFAWADHATGEDARRRGVHLYKSGFRLQSGYAFTQGALMSGMGNRGPSASLWKHENLHVWQNRCFGPFFTLIYLGWIIVFFVIGFIVGCFKGRPFTCGYWWSYMNNPYEVWAYESKNPGSRSGKNNPDCWSIGAAVGVAIPFILAVIAGAVAIVAVLV